MGRAASGSERDALLGERGGRAASLGGRVCGWCSRTRRVVALSLFVGACVIFAAYRSARQRVAVVAAVEVLPETYDAIVVGGGPAGSVMAKLLSDDKWRRVLLVEAGDASQAELGGKLAVPSPQNVHGLTMYDIPFFWTSVANVPSVHWDYPDVNIAKALGGCGIHNAMLYVRALPTDIEKWNMDGWSWEKTLDLYLQMEDYYGAESSFHSTLGFVRTSPPTFIDDISKAFLGACEKAGIPITQDFNAPGGRYGAGYYNFNTRDGVRESVARTFLGPILRGNDSSSTRDNFHLMLNTTVEKVTIGDDFTADGLQVRFANGTRRVIQLAANGTIVLTAGAINTPKILMQSGIGDGDVLNSQGIPTKKHLPRVGMNLQDHPVLGVTFESIAPHPYDVEEELEMYFNATQFQQADASSYGLMGSAGISAGAFLIPPGSTAPEIQLTLFPRKSEPHLTNSSYLNHSTEVLVTVALVNPRARNRVVLVKREHDGELIPYIEAEVPANETEHLQHDDVWKLAWGVRVVREIGAALAEKGIIGSELSPGASISSTPDLEKWVHRSVFRNTHWVGSAAMGHDEIDGVVDSHLRVFGINQLRVADASVIPFIPNGNVHSTVVMTAFHAAEIIKGDELARGG